jgi:Na+-transporting NADH:ubiquinone oxidoreductase subunit NqrC
MKQIIQALIILTISIVASVLFTGILVAITTPETKEATFVFIAIFLGCLAVITPTK